MALFEPYVITGVREGNISSIELVYNALFNKIHAYIKSYVNDNEYAKEIAQDCFLCLWEKRRELTPDANIQAFLYRIARNKSLNYLKKQLAGRNYTDYLKYRETAINYHALKDKTAELLLISELQTLINKTLDELPEPYRIVFEMSREEHLSYSEIACQLGISVKTVEYRMMHTLRLFRKNLRPYLPYIILFLF